MTFPYERLPTSNFNASPTANMKDSPTQMPACDRCRGQKLRCIRNQDSRTTCDRCSRAGAICVVDTSVRMGRPSKNGITVHVRNRERRKHQRTSSNSLSESLTKRQSHIAEDDVEWDDEQHMPEASSSKANTSSSLQYDNTADLGLSASAYQHDAFSLDNGLGYEWTTFASSDAFASMPASFVANDAAAEARSQDIASTEGSTQAKGKSGSEIVPTSTLAHQTLIETLSALNLKLYQQSQANSLNHTATHSCSLQNDIEMELPRLTASMLHSLQEFEELLSHLLQSRGDASDTTDPYDASRDIVETALQEDSTSYTHHANFQHLTDMESACLHSTLHSPTGKLSSLFSQGVKFTDHEPPSPKGNHQFNIPLSLLTISCYVNLVQVCRKVLVTIRCCLLFHDQKTQFSGFQIIGVSLEQDPHLQIILLTQVIMRFLDRIGRPLGCPYNGKSTEVQDDTLKGKGFSPHLLHFVLEEETNISGVPVSGAEVIKEEIRMLNSIINGDM